MAGRDNTTRIELLERQVSNIMARLGVQDILIKGASESLEKGTAVIEVHSTKITVVEQQLLLLLELKKSIEMISAIEKEMVATKKDVETLCKWKDDVKKERDETARRLWAFGPNIAAALISGIVSLAVALLVFWLNRPKQ